MHGNGLAGYTKATRARRINLTRDGLDVEIQPSRVPDIEIGHLGALHTPEDGMLT